MIGAAITFSQGGRTYCTVPRGEEEIHDRAHVVEVRQVEIGNGRKGKCFESATMYWLPLYDTVICPQQSVYCTKAAQKACDELKRQHTVRETCVVIHGADSKQAVR